MAVSALGTNHIIELEQKLEQQKDFKQRIVLLDQLTAFLVYTNVRRAQQLLSELQAILKYYPNEDIELNYHINTALVENQLYNYRLAEIHLLEAIKMIEDMGTVRQQVDVYIDYAGICINLNKMAVAEDYLQKASKLLKAFPDNQLEARIICREGFLRLHYNEYVKAIELLLTAEKKINQAPSHLQLKDSYFLTMIYSGLGNIYEGIDETDKSVQAYQKALDICLSMGMRTRLSWHYMNLGAGFIALQDYESAEKYLTQGLKITDDISQSARVGANANLGYCYFKKGQYQEALQLYNKAEQLYKEKKSDSNLFNIERWKAELFKTMGKHKKAQKHYIQAYKYAVSLDNNQLLSRICKDISEYYAELGEFENAYEYQKIHSVAAKRYASEVNSRRVIELEIKYDAAQKRQEAELLELKATRLQLKALRAQMNPHFMYNALNSIQSYIMSNQADSAAQFLARFAKLMRQSLEYSDMESITLEREIEFLRDYLFINQKLRFDNLEYQIQISDDLEEDILCVPTMIIQPYVENAIEHGLRTRKDGLVRIEFTLFDEETILCIVEDNGIGREGVRQLQELDKNYQNHKSRGTSITEKRLELLQDVHHNDQLSVATIDLKEEASHQARGTRVEIKIPVIDVKIK